MSRSLWGMGLSLLVATGCSNEGPTLALPFCTGSGAQLNLAVGSCSVVDPLVTGDSVVFPGNTAESPVTRGSTTLHDPTARFSCAPLPVQNGSASVGPSLLHPVATSNDRPIPHKLLDIA